MANAEKILELIRNKTKRVNLAFNPQLWYLFEQCVDNENISPTNKIEELMITYLEKNGCLDEK